MSLLERPISELAAELPGATAVFFNHGIRFCCQAEATLQEALEKKPDVQNQVLALLEGLTDLQKPMPECRKLDDNQLIDLILERFHEVHREQLRELSRLSLRVETVHGERADCPKGLTQHLVKIQQELESHMFKEENILFPMLRRGRPPAALGPISVMIAEHEDHISCLQPLLTLTNDLRIPSDACNSWRALYKGLQTFIGDLNTHIHLENNLLFARAREQQEVAHG